MSICSKPSCNRKSVASGLCDPHYRRITRGKDSDKPIRRQKPRGSKSADCSEENCTRASYAKGLCRGHYSRKANGSSATGEFREYAKKGEWGLPYLGKNGYVYQRRLNLETGKPQVRTQHRLVMAEIMGRDLLTHENVHHINGVRHDNRPENLELWSTKQPRGQRIPDKVSWAWEIIELYDPNMEGRK